MDLYIELIRALSTTYEALDGCSAGPVAYLSRTQRPPERITRWSLRPISRQYALMAQLLGSLVGWPVAHPPVYFPRFSFTTRTRLPRTLRPICTGLPCLFDTSYVL